MNSDGRAAGLDGLDREIFEGYPAPTLIVDRDVRLLMANRSARLMLGCASDATPLLPKRGGEALHCVHSFGPGGCGQQEACKDCVIRNSVQQALRTGGVHRARTFMQVQGEHGPRDVCVLVSTSPIRHGGETHVVLTLEQVSDVQLKDNLVRTEQALHQAHERAASLARFPEENPDPVLRIAGDSTLAYANEAARSALRELQLQVGEVAAPSLAGPARQAVAEDRRVRAETSLGGRVLELSFCPVGVEVNVYGRDITDQKQAERALREADRHKSEFLAVLSHELRNPLAPIRNSLYLLDRIAPSSEQAARARNVLRRQTDHLTRLIDDLLDVTRISSGKIKLTPTTIDARDVVRHTCEDHRAIFDELCVELRLDMPPDPVWIEGDATRLSQVIGNLLQNAAKFTPEHGSTAVTVAAADGRAELRVRDDGIGIEPESLDRMFEPFAQAERGLARTQGGLGLGLALVKGLVELHGGSVQARSPGANRGSEFVVWLPLVADPKAADAEARARPLRASRSVLVIEDYCDAAQSLAEVLALHGHRVDVATDGRTGIAKARELKPDVVLCDIGLPDVDGYEVARTLRADPGLRATYLVALSGYAQPEDRRRALEAGFDSHVGKPAPLEELAALVLERG